jgi:hypothetical protein
MVKARQLELAEEKEVKNLWTKTTTISPDGIKILKTNHFHYATCNFAF